MWQGPLRKDGYAQFSIDGKMVLVHKWAYEYLHGPVPDGKKLDHGCHDRSCTQPGYNCPHRACCNPDHLKVSTQLENIRRGLGHGSETHCPKGHPYDEENTYWHNGGRWCRACDRLRNAIRRKLNRETVSELKA